MTPRALIHATAYATAFALRMELHGVPKSEPRDGVVVEGVVDARAEADRWARMVAEAAVEWSER